MRGESSSSYVLVKTRTGLGLELNLLIHSVLCLRFVLMEYPNLRQRHAGNGGLR